MTFRASNVLPANGLQEAKQLATFVRGYCQARSTSFASGSDSDEILAMVDQLRAHRQRFDELSQIPGIAAYAQAQEDDNTYNVATEFTDMLTAIDAVITTVVTLFPVDGSGFLLAYTFGTQGARVARTFTAANLSQVITDLDAVVASIS